MDLKSYLTKNREIVDKKLREMLPNGGELEKAIQYCVLSSGKRIRPILAIASAEACGGNIKAVLPTACAIECLHAFTLIHDDLPAIDNSNLRRGRLSCHKAFSESTAILAGDALSLLAYEIILKYSSKSIEPGILLKVFKELLFSAGTKGVVGGEFLDIKFEKKKVTASQIKKMYLMKTGSFINASVKCGAILSKANKNRITKLGVYAENLGFAFQITDDLLDLTGESIVTGKPSGLDKKKGKNTYAGLVGEKKAKLVAEKCIEKALYQLKSFGRKADPLREIARYVLVRNK